MGWAGEEVRGGGDCFPKESQRTQIRIQNKEMKKRFYQWLIERKQRAEEVAAEIIVKKNKKQARSSLQQQQDERRRTLGGRNGQVDGGGSSDESHSQNWIFGSHGSTENRH